MDPERKVVEANRCPICNKKLSLVAVRCRCGHRFCQKHRLAELHACSFDFKKEGRTYLSKTVVKCDGVKVDKI
jgi:predicted nucleic acid binding AN1-type Zn finger protein